MSMLTIPRSGIPLTLGDRISPEWYRFLYDLTERVGGVAGWSVHDLMNAPAAVAAADVAALASDVDSLRLADALSELREQVAELSKTDIETQIAQLREQVAYMGGMKRKRVISGSIAITPGNSTATFTISPALSSLDMADLRFLGFTHSSDANGSTAQTGIELTNTTTVTARRTTTGNTSTVYFQITEYTQ
jgi:hypothetical protein